MSVSNEHREWHLTPRGWEPGTLQLDARPVGVTGAPNDRWLTCVYSEKISHTTSPVAESVIEKWRSSDEEKVNQLLTNFGPCPEQLEPRISN